MSTPRQSQRRGLHTASALALPAVLTLGLLLQGCGGAATSESGEKEAGDPVAGGTLKFAINSDTNCLDPHQSPADIAGFFSRPILDSLVALNPDGTLDPWLATEWTVSKDELTYSFTLRDDVTFSNGEKFDGEAVKANLDHIVAPETKSQLAANTIATYAGTKVIDPTHVEVSFTEPNSAFLPSLASAYLGIQAPSTLEQAPEKLCWAIVGSGPFISKEGHTPGKGISYVRNDDYNWGPGNADHEGKAYLDALDIQIVTEDSSRYGALTSKQVDAIGSVPPVNVAQLKKTSGFDVETVQAPGGNYNYFPNTSKGLLTDKRLREALRVGIDWDTLVEKRYFGVYQPANGPLSPSTVGYDSSIESAYSYDADKAAQLLDEAGWTGKDSEGYRTKDGKRLTLVQPQLAAAREQRDTLLEQVQAAAKELGIEHKIVKITIDELYERLGSGDYDLLDMSWQRSSPDALRTLFGSENVPKGGSFGTNLGAYSNPEVDAALKEALGQVDLTEQGKSYAKAQQLITEDAAVLPVYVFNYVLGRSDDLHGVRFEPQAFPTFYDAWKSQ